MAYCDEDHSNIKSDNDFIVTNLLDNTVSNISLNEVLKPSDIEYDWDGVIWPLLKKYQFNYSFDNHNTIRFKIPNTELDTSKLTIEQLTKIKDLYTSAGWAKCNVRIVTEYPNDGDLLIKLTRV